MLSICLAGVLGCRNQNCYHEVRRLSKYYFAFLYSVMGSAGVSYPLYRSNLQRSIMQASTLKTDSCLLNIKCFFIIFVLFMYLDYLYSCPWCLKFFLSRLQNKNIAECEESGIFEGAPSQEDPKPCSCDMCGKIK